MNNFSAMESEIENINSYLKEKYSRFFSMNSEDFRNNILLNIGNIKKLKKLSETELKNFGVLVGVDGSTNRVGGAYPHYLELFQALAKATRGTDLFLNRYYSPMTEETSYEEEKPKENREKILAEIELEAAIKSFYRQKPDMIMMDGGLIRYQINAKKKYEELKNICEDENVILFGVVKDIKTNIISRNNDFDVSIFDRELLYGKLEIGEILEIRNDKNNKYIEGDLASAFLRTSSSPNAIGLDILESQKNYLMEVANLVYTLTPMNSRGVPLWLDIVDKEVKITDEIIRTMLEEYLDRDIYEKFFISERDRRSL